MKYNQFWSLFLMLILLLQLNEDLVLRLWYQLDNDSFAETFCENIDQPQLECKGKCFIGEQLEQNAKSGSLLTKAISPPSISIVFILSQVENSNILHQQLYNQRVQVYSFIAKEWIPTSVFPPPESLV